MSLLHDESHGPGPSVLAPRHNHAGGLGDPLLERLCFGGLVTVAVVVALVLAAGHLSALIVSGGWPRFEATAIPPIVWRAVADPGDPGQAWRPVNHGAPVPGGVVWWVAFATVTAAASAPVVLALRARHHHCQDSTSEWATRRHVGRLQIRGTDTGRLVVGTRRGRKLAVESRHSLLVLGPTQTGKTTGLAIPAILEWPGPVVATSVKGDLVRHTIGWRSHLGDVHVYDRRAPPPTTGPGGHHWLAVAPGPARRGAPTTSPWPAKRPSAQT